MIRLVALRFDKGAFPDRAAIRAWGEAAGLTAEWERAYDDADVWTLPVSDEPAGEAPSQRGELAPGVVAVWTAERAAPPVAADEPPAVEPAPAVPAAVIDAEPAPLATRIAPPDRRTAVCVFRALGAEDAAPDGFNRTKEGSTVFVASEPIPDRYDDIVDSTWLLDNYRRNPVVLYGHSWGEPPIGRAVQVGVVAGRLLAEVEWDMEDEDSARIASKVARGFLNTVSVGFRPGRCIDRRDLPDTDPRHNERGAVLFDNELLELSVVAVPALPSAEAVRSPSALLDAVRDRARTDAAFLRSLEAVVLAAPVPRPASTGDPEPARHDGWWGNLER